MLFKTSNVIMFPYLVLLQEILHLKQTLSPLLLRGKESSSPSIRGVNVISHVWVAFFSMSSSVKYIHGQCFRSSFLLHNSTSTGFRFLK